MQSANRQNASQYKHSASTAPRKPDKRKVAVYQATRPVGLDIDVTRGACACSAACGEHTDIIALGASDGFGPAYRQSRHPRATERTRRQAQPCRGYAAGSRAASTLALTPES
jgi:hypothetical protein